MAESRNTFHRILPYLTAFVLFAGISAAYFAPQFSGKEIKMHDMTQYAGMSKEIMDHIDKYGEDPQWTGALFSGMPAPLIYMKYDSMILKAVYKVGDFMGRPASFIFVAMAAFFIMLLMFGVNPWIGIIPSLAYGLSTYFFLIIGAGHITKMVALAYAPLMIGSMYFTYRKNMWLGAALTALFASLEIAASHPQITYYFVFILIGLWINELVRAIKKRLLPRFAKATGLLAIAAIMAVGSNIAPLWYINDYGKYSMRGGSELTLGNESNIESKNSSGLDLDYATAWSYGKTESFNMFIPNFMGGASDLGFSDDGPVANTLARYNARQMAQYLPAYWGDQPITGGPTYLGAVIIYLAILGLFLLKGREKWWIAIVTAIAIMLGWGRNFMLFTELFFNLLPGYNKFRTVSMILVIAEWSIPFLAAIILNKVWKQGIDKQELISGIKKSLYVAGGVALFFLLFGGMLFNFSAESDLRLLNYGYPEEVLSAMRAERASMLRLDSLRSLVFVILTSGLLWLWAKEKLKGAYMIAGLAILVCTDLVPVNLRFLPQSRFLDKNQVAIKPSEADLAIMSDTTAGYRVLNLTVDPFSDATTSYFHRSVGGYHGAKMQRYQDVIEHHLSKNNVEVLDMLNTKYFIVPDNEGKPAVQLNPHANGPAWFIQDIIWVDNPNQEIEALGNIHTKTEAIIDRRFSDQLAGFVPTVDSTANIVLSDYRPNNLVYKYTSQLNNIAVFSEIYYDKGWKAYIDGVEQPYFRVNYILRGMLLPAGSHTVEFVYKAENFKNISTVTFTFSLLILLSVAGATIGTIVCKRKNKNQNAG